MTMLDTVREKKRFIRELCDNVKRDLLNKAAQYPKEWDGIELRRLIARRFNMAVMGDFSGKRKRNYENELLVRNLD
jgi:hypothetical protein